MNLLSLPDKVLTQVTWSLELKDLLALGDSHTRLRDLVYKTPEVWTSELLFPAGNKRITDRFTQRIIPRITRHYGILSLKMIDLPLTWAGYFMIFDQFAHSVKHIRIDTTHLNLTQLAHHLTIFAGNLALLQQSNKIPITFRQYVFDQEELEATLVGSNYLGQSTLHNLSNQFAQIRLDDPPFERLEALDITCKEQHPKNVILQLQLLTDFLSGRMTVDPVHSPIPTNKRTREESSNSFLHDNKYMKHNNDDSHHFQHRSRIAPASYL